MSKKVGNIFYVEAEPARHCDLCGALAELRPYGPNGENVCFDCAMKDEEAAGRQFMARVLGPSEDTIQ